LRTNIAKSSRPVAGTENRRVWRVKIEVNGEALKLLEDFVKYAKLYPEEMADIMYYDLDGLNRRRNQLEKVVNLGKQ